MTSQPRTRPLLRRAVLLAAAVAVLGSGCSDTDGADGVDLPKLNVGTYSTTARTVNNQPSEPEGTVLEGIRMSEAVADSSQFDPKLLYLWQADPVPETASLVPVIGEAAARAAASALEVSNWTDLAKTLTVPLPKHPDVIARYTPGTGALLVDTAIGPYVLHLMLDGPAEGIETRVGDLDPVLDKERELLQGFKPTPASEIPALPRDLDGLLARMVNTDPDRQPPVSPTFAVFGPIGALRDQLPSIRKDSLYEKWGVDRFAVSGDQHLYRLRDHQAALDMQAEFVAQFSGGEHEIDADPNVPDERCFQANNPTGVVPGFACRITFDRYYTVVRADTASSAREKAAAQYALLATM